MNVTLKCFATLSRFTPPDAEAFAITPGETVAELVKRIGIPPAELKLAFINGAHVEFDAPLADGDRVGLFPAVGGG
jgi:molybdopterin converting factor small subunit